MSITKSTNTTGNPYHTSEDGKFTSPNNAGESAYNEELDKQAVSDNPKYDKLNEAIANKVPYYSLNKKQQRSTTDHLIFSPLFEKYYGAQITEALGENYIKAMLPVKSAQDDMAGNDFFLFTKDGTRLGVDLKTFSSARGTIKIGLMMTDPPGSGKIRKDYFINENKNNSFFAFQSVDFVNDERNDEMIYNEALAGKDVTERAVSGCAYFATKNSLNLYFEQNGLGHNEITELCSDSENGLRDKLENIISFVRENSIYSSQDLSRYIKNHYGLDFVKDKNHYKISQDYGSFSVACEKDRKSGDLSIYIEIGEGDFNDIDDVQYFDWRK